MVKKLPVTIKENELSMFDCLVYLGSSAGLLYFSSLITDNRVITIIFAIAGLYLVIGAMYKLVGGKRELW
jgi:hypothetical protein